jgi:hypothetical protein
VETGRSTHATTRLKRHPISTSRRLVVALAITHLEGARDDDWERKRFDFGFGREGRGAAAGVAFAVLGGELICESEDTRNKGSREGIGKSIPCRHRRWEARQSILGGRPSRRKYSKTSRRRRRIEGGTVSVLASVRLVVSVAESQGGKSSRVKRMRKG